MKEVFLFFCNSILQIKKIKLIHAKTFPVSGRIDVTDKDQLLVRTKEETKYWIRVMHRLTGEIVNQIPSMCNHHGVLMKKYPQNQDYAFESCSTCEQVYAHNINTGESLSVHKGSKIMRMCAGPAGSLLVLKQGGGLFKLEWDKTQAQLVFVQDILNMSGKSLPRLCYVERHDILLYTTKDLEEYKGYEIIAERLGSESIAWRLSGPVDGHIIKLVAITCDSDGNAYISDQGNNRILKINSLTGEILGILLLEEKEVWSMRWSNREPNLTLWDHISDQISTYFVPE